MNSPHPIPTFWTEATDDVALYLRRYTNSGLDVCPVAGYHTSLAFVGSLTMPEDDQRVIDAAEYAGDERWPTSCQCGEPFADDDPWQVFTERIMRRADTGELITRGGLPPGALYDATWMPDVYRGVDGIKLAVVCPPAGCSNVWFPDKRWTRTGDPTSNPPTVHLSPSIEIAFTVDAAGQKVTTGRCYYHGHLHGGVLTPG